MGVRGELEKMLRKLCKQANVPLQVVPKERMNRMTGGNHQGLIGYISAIQYQRLDDILPIIFEQAEQPLIVLLDGVTDVRNFGAIARSAECLGAHALVVEGKNIAPVNAEAIKTSAGALTTLPVCRTHSLVNAIEQLKLYGIKVISTDVNRGKAVDQLELTVPLAVIMGSEGKGVRKALLDRADECLIIPQTGKTDSLNVSVASGIIFYEVSRQRRA